MTSVTVFQGGSRRLSVSFEAVSVELQRSTVFGDRSDDLIGRPFGKVGCNLEPDCHVGAGLAYEVRDHFFGNAPSVTADTRGIQRHRSKEAPNRRRRLRLLGLALRRRTADRGGAPLSGLSG